MNLYKKIFSALEKAKINYLIVGGVAVNLYGYSRFTGDIDILLALDEENLLKVDKLMHEMGYTERLPIKLKDLKNPKKVENYIQEKNLRAFTFVSSANAQLDIDIIIQESLNFNKYKGHQVEIEVWELKLPVINLDDLIGMKKEAGRDKDLLDLEALFKIKEM